MTATLYRMDQINLIDLMARLDLIEEHGASVPALDVRQVARWTDRCHELLRQRVPSGRYAIGEGDSLRFYHINKHTEGRWAGYVFVEYQAGSETWPLRNRLERERILVEIGKDPRAASIRYGHEIGACGVCGRTLTNPESIAAGIGPVCAGKAGW